jgi:hypothetical protein
MKRISFVIFILLFVQVIAGYGQTVLFSENFESGELPLNWSQVFVNGAVNWRFENGGHTFSPAVPNSRKPMQAHGGSYNALFQFMDTKLKTTRLVTKKISALEFAVKPELHFYHAQVARTVYNDKLRVYYKNGATSSWVMLKEYTEATTDWVERIILLPENDLSADYYLAFEGENNVGNATYGTCVDDIQIIETGILQKYLNSTSVEQASEVSVASGSKNNPMLKLKVKVMGNSGTCPLNSLTLTSLNTSDADIETGGVKLYATEEDVFNTDHPVGSGVSFASGKAVFTGLNYNLPTGYSYIWVTYDVKSTAGHRDVLDAKFEANSININGQNYFSTEQSPEGKRSVLQSIYYDDFDTDLKWTLSGEFEYGSPQGLGGSQGNHDPSAAFSGTRIIGTDLTGLNEYPGDYEKNLGEDEYSAISDTFDFTYYNDLSIRYMRYLNVGINDEASVDVSYDEGQTWHTAWYNPGMVFDDSWKLHEIDISDWANRKSKVLIRYSLGPTNDYWQLSGWNIDDFSITGNYITNDVGISNIVAPVNGCSHSAVDPITVIVKNYGAEASANLIPIQFSFNNGAKIFYDTLKSSIPFGDSVEFTFKSKIDLSATGIYAISATTNMAHDEDLTNNAFNATVTIQPTIQTDYTESFENNKGLWFVDSPKNISSWEWGNPGYGITPPSGSNLWMTLLTESYLNSDSSFVEGVCYKNDDNIRKYLRMKYWVASEGAKDGANLQYSTDNGATWALLDTTIAGWTWYPGTVSALGAKGWSGNSGGWVTSKVILPSTLTHASLMKFRMAFASDADSNNIGFAFDDFKVAKVPNDIGVQQIDSHENACQGVNPDQVTITIKNFGINKLVKNDTVKVGFDLNNHHVTTETFLLSDNLNPGATLQHTFASHIDLSAAGNYNLKAYTLNKEDREINNTRNDTVSLDFTVYPNPLTNLIDTIPTHRPDTVIIKAYQNNTYDYWWNGVAGGSTYNVHKAGWYNLQVTATRGNGCTSFDSTFVELLFNDTGVDSLLYPYDDCGLTTREFLTVRVRNYGTDSIYTGEKIPVTYKYNGTTVTDTLTLSSVLHSRKTVDFTFDKGPVDLSKKAFYAFKLYTSYASDTVYVNDTIQKSVEILGRPAVSLGPDKTVKALTHTLDAGSGFTSYLWDNGTTLQTRTITESGSYWVKVYDDNQCDNSDTAYVRLKIRDISPDGFVSPVSNCSYSTGDPVTMSILNSGTDTVPSGTTIRISYTFKNGARSEETMNLTSQLIPGATATHTFTGTVDLPGAGDYNLEATAVTDGDLRSTNDTLDAMVYRYNKPVVDFGLDKTVIIEASSLLLNAGYSPHYTYIWQDGSSDYQYTVTKDGLYYATATDSRTSCFDRDTVRVYLVYTDVGVTETDMPVDGCKGDLEGVTVKIKNLGTSNIGKDAPIYVVCDVNGTRVTIDTLVRSSIFVTGSVLDLTLTGKIPISQTGGNQVSFYTLAVADKVHGDDTLAMTYNAYPNPVVDFGDVNGTLKVNLPYDLDAGAGNKSYQWQDGSDSQVYHVTQYGSYSVTVTSEHDCRTSKDVVVALIDAVDERTGAQEVTLYPNPNNGLFNISLSKELKGDVMVKVVNNQGQVVYNRTLAADDLANEQINVQHLSRGLYHVSIITEKQTYQGKIVIR